MTSDIESAEAERLSEDVRLEDVVKWFLSQYEYLHEYRLQKLIYLVELLSIEKKEGNRITAAEYKPYMYGSYSEDLPETLESLEGELTTKPDMHHGKTIQVYRYEDDHDIDDDEVIHLLNVAHELSNSKTNEALADWSKQSWLYENTPFGEPMNFKRYYQRLGDDDLKSDVKKLTEF